MLARRTTLQHPVSGAAIDMPRLVPSFSSKGFPLVKDEVTGQRLSEVTYALELVGPTISDSILLSAYDIYHNYLREPGRFYGSKELVFIDSGGYELSTEFDSTELKQESYEPDHNYDSDKHKQILSNLPTKYPIVITNFDYKSRGKKIEEQILEAQHLFNNFPNFGLPPYIGPAVMRVFHNNSPCLE